MNKKISLPLLIITLILFSIFVALLANIFLFKQTNPSTITTSIAEKLPAGDFTLQSADGDVSLSDYRGKVVLLYFGYTYCPDICPTSLALMGQAMASLNEEEKTQVQGLFVSVDPERDSLEHLKKYSHYYGDKIVGVTGKASEIRKITKRYGVAYEIQKKDKNGNYSINHTSTTLLIDKNGKLKDLLPHGVPAKKIVEKLRENF